MSSVPLGPFEIFETVGSGGMGVVRRGSYRALGAEVPVAIKFIKPPAGDLGRFREAFVREVQSAARLHHPNIVSVYDTGGVTDAATAESLEVDVGTAYLVIEYVDGGTLESQVGKLAWPDLRRVLLHLLDALAHAHALGIVHRDLKPANVLCRATDEGLWPMLTDFGIARAMDAEPTEPDDDEPQRVAGTPYYMAPEHVMGRWRDEGPWTDVYALGALAWHLVTGQVPFAGDTGDVLRAHLMTDLPSFTPGLDLPPGFEPWVRRLLDKDLTRRYRRAADAAWALMQLDETLDPTRAGAKRGGQLVVSEPGPTLSGLTTSLQAPTQVEAPSLKPMTRVRKHGLAPPLPDDWRRGDEGKPRTLRGAGLGLFGLRPVPVVGRDEERSALWDVLSRVHATQRPHGVIISGAPGTGKSRLVSWLSERAEEVGGAILFKATHSQPMTYADGLVAMMTRFTRTQGLGFEEVLMRVRSLYSDLDLRGEDVLFDAVALTERILGLIPENASGPRFQSRREWFSALLRVLGALTRERPVLLWLDDVQCSTESLEFAHYILSHQDDDTYPICVVCTVPDLLESDAALARLESVEVLENVEQLDLEPLSDDEMRDLVVRMLGLSSELAELVIERTAGSPLFAVQLVEDWVARGALKLGPDGFAAPEELALQLPDDIHATWQRRVDDVLARGATRTAARIALEIAAVLGRDVDLEEWRSACTAYGVNAPDSLVADLVGAGLASRLESGWSFVHALLRDSMLREIGDDGDVLAAYHAACALGLRARRAEHRRPRTSRRLAEHLVGAGDPQGAFDELSTAIDLHRDMEEQSALLVLADRAVDIAEEHDLDLDPVRRATLAWHRAAMLRNLGDVEATLEAYEEGMHFLLEGETLDDFLREPDPRKNPVLANLLVERAVVLVEAEGELERGDEILAVAQKLAIAVANPRAIGWASKVRSRILCTLGRVEEGVAAARVAVDAYGTLKRERPDYYFAGLSELAGALRVAGHLDEARAIIARADRWSEQVGSREALALVAMERAELARAAEDYDEAIHQYQSSAQLFGMLGSKNALLVTLNLCLVDVEAGNLVTPRDELRTFRDDFSSVGMEALATHAELALAACAAAAGDWEEFDDAFYRTARNLRQAHVRDPELAGLAVICARECEERGEHARRDECVGLADELGGVGAHPTRSAELDRLRSIA